MCVVQPRDMLPMNMFIPSLHVMNLNVNEWLLLFPGWKGLNHKIMNSVFNRLRSKCLPTEHHKLFSFVPSLLHRYQFVQTEVQISIRSVQTGVFLDMFRNPLGPLGPSRPRSGFPWFFPMRFWRYTFFAISFALASLLGAALGDYLFHNTMEAGQWPSGSF